MIDDPRSRIPVRPGRTGIELKVRRCPPGSIRAEPADPHSGQDFLCVMLTAGQGPLIVRQRIHADTDSMFLQHLIAIALAISVSRQAVPIAKVMKNTGLAEA